MAATGTEKVVEAYNQAMASGFAAVEAGVTQTTASVKLMTDTVRSERTEYGRVWEEAGKQILQRNENFAASIPALMQGMTTVPASGFPAISPEAKEAASKLIDAEIAFYQSWTQAWLEYLGGAERRRSAAAQAMLESQGKVVSSGKDAVQSAVKYGEAVVDWTFGSLNATKS